MLCWSFGERYACRQQKRWKSLTIVCGGYIGRRRRFGCRVASVHRRSRRCISGGFGSLKASFASSEPSSFLTGTELMEVVASESWVVCEGGIHASPKPGGDSHRSAARGAFSLALTLSCTRRTRPTLADVCTVRSTCSGMYVHT